MTFMNPIKRIIPFVISLLILPVISFAAPEQDPIIIQHQKLNAKRLQPNAVPNSTGQWTRIEIPLFAKENPDDKANNKKWIRNVDVDLTLIYKDQNAKGANDFIVLRSKARLFALEINKKIPVVFYIPSEAYDIYRLSAEPFAWKIEISIEGTPIELNKDNMKTMLSKNIFKGNNPRANYERFMKLVETAAKANEGVLMPLPDCPYNVKFFEYSKPQPIPNYLPTK